MHARLNTTFGNAGTPGGWRAVGATPSLPVPRRALARGGSVRRGFARQGFTLTEILIVIGLIVLVIALAVPAFNAMTGGRSIDAATNQLSAMLGRARMEAIGLQEPRGLLFYRDTASGRIAGRLVRTGEVTAVGISDVTLDLVPNSDPMFLPVGVGLQLVDDSPTGGGANDRYIGFNKNYGGSTLAVAVGGVILFDQGGRLTSRPYGFLVRRGPTDNTLTEMGNFLKPGTGSFLLSPNTQNVFPAVIRSQFGFVLFDDNTFRDLGFTDADNQLDSSVNKSDELTKEEAWLDTNAVPVLVNRYNGTLVRGE
jgi:prepilin-type N-terminal cleavage/methylation domain-containing protein